MTKNRGGFNDWTPAQRKRAAKKQWKDPSFQKKRKGLNKEHASLMKEKWEDPKFRKMMLEKRKHSWTEERRANQSRKIRKHWKDPEYAKAATAGFRRPRSEEHKQSIGDALRGRKCPEISARQLGRKFSKETKEKIRKAHLGKKHPREMVERRNKSIEAAWTSEKRKEHSKILLLPLSEVKKRLRQANRLLKILSTEYKGVDSPLKIKCKKCGTKWKESWSRMYAHLGKCPKCNPHKFSASEEEVRRIIERLTGWKFPKAVPEFLRGWSSHPMRLDGYNERHQVAFEFQGYQHTVYPNTFHKTKKEFLKQKRNDKRKRNQCTYHGILLICIPYWKTDVKGFIRKKLIKHGLFYKEDFKKAA